MPTSAAAPSALSAFATDVRAGLGTKGQKTLPSSYLYDALGSALFEAITALPEYGVTRAEERVLARHAVQMATLLRRKFANASSATSQSPEPSHSAHSAHSAHAVRVVELGSGTGRKTRLILEALAANGPVVYNPIDISGSALQQCCQALSDIAGVRIEPFERDYLDGLAEVGRVRQPGEHTVVLFLGSTIGNFAQAAATSFLAAVRATLQPGDALLLGADLLKPVDELIQAYDDEIGVTAAFNLNLLSRINRELEGNFVIDAFEHVARFNETARSIEMHLRSRRAQRVTIAGADLDIAFAQGETIWTESSHKYRAEEVVQMGEGAHFGLLEQWIDDRWPFAETLMLAQ